VPVTPTEVRAAIIRVISEKKGGVEIISQSDKEYMVDIDRDGARLTGPVAGSAADGKIDRQPLLSHKDEFPGGRLQDIQVNLMHHLRTDFEFVGQQ